MYIKGKEVYASKVSWAIHTGKAIEEIQHLTLMKLCDFNDCVNPAHYHAKILKDRKLGE